MLTPTPFPENVVHVEYCRSCQTHNWCTHHDQAKYYQSFLKISQMIAEHLPQLEVIGNIVPPHLIPFKPTQNKYIDSNTNKYVIYPQIGAFEVTLNGISVFSKKDNNAWPHLPTLIGKIWNIIEPGHHQLIKVEIGSKSSKNTHEHTPSKTLKTNQSDQKRTPHKDQTKNFTLTDHFKLYRAKQKNSQKDWLTQKPQSEDSYQQISQFRLRQSRGESEESEQSSKKGRDHSGQSKLKEMLKNRSLMMKEQGKKEMIIKLDSIEQQNAYYDDNGLTQRTAQKNPKKSKMKELQDDFSSLQNKFIKFESKVKDIHSEFDYKQEPTYKSRGKNMAEIRETTKGYSKQSIVLEKQMDKQNKLDQFLNATEAQKNQKLYRIYGQGKLLKQNAKRNRQLLKHKQRSQNQDQSDEQTSQTNSNQASMVNILAFKPKVQKTMEKQIINLIHNKKGHKYSTLQKYQNQSNNAINDPRYKTEQHFYHKGRKQNPKVQNQSENSLEPINRLFKNSSNTMSTQNFHQMKVRQNRQKQSKGEQDGLTQYSENAKQNIKQIHVRINKIQENINHHKQKAAFLAAHQHERQLPHNNFNKSRSNSGGSSDFNSQPFIQKNHGKQKKTPLSAQPSRIQKRSSHRLAGNSKKQRYQNLSQMPSNILNKKQSKNESGTIEEESEHHDSSCQSESQEEYYQGGHLYQKKKQATNNIDRQKTNRKQANNPQKHQAEQQDSSGSQNYEESGHPNKKQKSSRIHTYKPHEQIVFLKKQKEWKQSQAIHHQPKHISNHTSPYGSRKKQHLENRKGGFSESQETGTKHTNNTNRLKHEQHQTPKKHNQHESSSQVIHPAIKSRAGKIKKNKPKDPSAFTQDEAKAYNRREIQQEQREFYMRNQEQNSNPNNSEADQNEAQWEQGQNGHPNQEEFGDQQMTAQGKLVHKAGKKHPNSLANSTSSKEKHPTNDQQNSTSRYYKKLLHKYNQQSDETLEKDRVQGQKINSDELDQENGTSPHRNSLEMDLNYMENGKMPSKSYRKHGQTNLPTAAPANTQHQQKQNDFHHQKPAKSTDQATLKQQGKSTKKQKKTKHKGKKNKVKLIQNKAHQIKEYDLQLSLTKQYSQFLQIKISHQQAKLLPISKQTQLNQHQDADVKANVLTSPSGVIITQQCLTNFLSYVASQPPVTLIESTSNDPSTPSAEIEEEQSQEQSEYSENEEQQGNQSNPRMYNKYANQEELASESLLTQSKSHAKQYDNVYSQPKQRSYFHSASATQEISIQTDQVSHSVLTSVTNAAHIKSGISKPQLKSKDPANPISQSQANKQPYNAIHNNYFCQPKKQPFKNTQKPIERAHIISKLYGQSLNTQTDKFASIINGHQQPILKEQGSVISLEQLYPNGTLINEKGLQVQLLSTKFTKVLKIIQLLCEKSQWLISRLFEDRNGVLKEKTFGVWVSRHYQWECVIVDPNIRVDQHNSPLFSKHSGNQMWFNVLEKALAKSLGGYQQLLKADSSHLFTMLTGCNYITARIKQDPTKNSKLLHLINDSLRKNYLVHAQKNFQPKSQRQSVYYINSIRKCAEEQILIQLNQDGKENFWIKHSKFIQQFQNIHILHLRINHYFAHLDLPRATLGQITVVQMEFHQEGQGCVTLSGLGENGPLRAFLYREEKNKVLKLVGQAKEKNKSHLFFQCSFTEGRYYVFTQAEERPARLTFQGEGQPSLRITEQIHSQGLKNEMAEYLPINDSENIFKHSQAQTMNEWRVSRPKLKDNFVQSLRSNFVDYMLGRRR